QVGSEAMRPVGVRKAVTVEKGHRIGCGRVDVADPGVAGCRRAAGRRTYDEAGVVTPRGAGDGVGVAGAVVDDDDRAGAAGPTQCAEAAVEFVRPVADGNDGD